MMIRPIAAAVALIAATGVAWAHDDMPTFGDYMASCGPTFACQLTLSPGRNEDDMTVTLRAVTTTGRHRVVCEVEAQGRPGTGLTTVGDQRIGGLVATLQGVPVVVTGMPDRNSVLVSAEGPICRVKGMPNRLTHLAVVGIYERQAGD